MRWTYQEYVTQPAWFIEMIKIKSETESEYERNTAPKPPKK